ncbi:hypothetical protein [Nannocystis pusilla]
MIKAGAELVELAGDLEVVDVGEVVDGRRWRGPGLSQASSSR